jgi:hypothetical protein
MSVESCAVAQKRELQVAFAESISIAGMMKKWQKCKTKLWCIALVADDLVY